MLGIDLTVLTKREHRLFGYARVSTQQQNLDRQIRALKEEGVPEENIFADKASGKDFDRPEFQRLLDTLEEGDEVRIPSIDRLGRDYREIKDMWERITKKIGADIVILDMPILDTRKTIHGVLGVLIVDIVLQVLAYVAQIERENIHARQKEGIEAAQARGIHCGRFPKPMPDNFGEIYEAVINHEMTQAEAAKLCGCCTKTFRKWMKEYEQEHEDN